MNRQILKQYINEYKLNFDSINQRENYKLKAIKCFQDNWNIDASNFFEMLSKSMSFTRNLLTSGQYFPLRMLEHYAKDRSEDLRILFRNLYNEDNDILERIKNFQNGVAEINQILFRENNTYQDHRAILVYLTLRYPERYFFYKFQIFKKLSEKLEITYNPIRGRIENIGHFNNLCEIIKHELSNDEELLQLHKDRIKADFYSDTNLNVLTQEFIYAVARHLHKPMISASPIAIFQRIEEVSVTGFTVLPDDQPSFKGRNINFIQNNIENKRIGDLGELWVLKYEIEKLKQMGRNDLISNIKHTAKDEGDGTGYDILSFDQNGQPIYIEVKTTKGHQKSTFYITKTELERSKLERDNFYLYRIYNYNEGDDTAQMFIIRGDLTHLCEFPSLYKINLAND